MSDLHDRSLLDDPAVAVLSGRRASDTIPPLLADICTAAANSAGALSSIVEQPDRYVCTFGLAGSDRTATVAIQKQLFIDAIDWGERRIRAELEHEAARACATLTTEPA